MKGKKSQFLKSFPLVFEKSLKTDYGLFFPWENHFTVFYGTTKGT